MLPLFSATINAADIAISGTADMNPVAIPFFLLGLTAIKPAAKADIANDNIERNGIILFETPDLTIISAKKERIAHKITSSHINANR